MEIEKKFTMKDFTMKIVITFARVSLFVLVLSKTTCSIKYVQNNSEDERMTLPDKVNDIHVAENEMDEAELESSTFVHKIHTIDENRALFGNDVFHLLKDPSKHAHRKKGNGKHDRRQRRKRHSTQNHHHEGHPRKSCKTKSAFIFRSEATDIFGNTVTLHPSIHVGGVAIDQYFYETFCHKEACTCTGVDENNYRSACETTHSFTYARVIKQGEIGWTQIMVRSGCSCVIHKRKPKRRLINIMDAI